MIEFDELYPEIGRIALETSGAPLSVQDSLQAPTRGQKNTAAYNAHSYPTKVPPEAIEPFIEHHTRPGDVVLDAFCGSGMTGLAARRLGRTAILNDLSFGATHLAWNISTPCDPIKLGEAAAAVLAAVEPSYSRWYRTTGVDGKPDTIAWTLHSQVVECPSCNAGSSLWDDATDRTRGVVAADWACPACGMTISKKAARPLGSRAAWIAVGEGRRRIERNPSEEDVRLIAEVATEPIQDWFPDLPLGPTREMYIRSALQLQGVHAVSDFWTPRNLRAVARLWAEICAWPDERIRQALAFAFTNTAWHATRMRRYNARGGQRPLTGTLYIPQLSIEANPGPIFAHKIRQLQRFYADAPKDGPKAQVLRSSATSMPLPDASIDYVFCDPPFGSNIFYADLAVVWETWLAGVTPVDDEAVVNKSLRPRSGGKTIDDYQRLMEGAFGEIARVLKPDAWATVVFQSSDSEVWSALRTAVERAGFDLANASYLDKQQQSHKGYKGRSGKEDVASFDVILNLHKPGRQRRIPKPPGGYRDAGDMLARHLSTLPAVGADPEADRQRTLPFLHSLLVQAHFNGSLGLDVGQYALVRRICEERFFCDDQGRWTLDEGVLLAP